MKVVLKQKVLRNIKYYIKVKNIFIVYFVRVFCGHFNENSSLLKVKNANKSLWTDQKFDWIIIKNISN